MTKLYLSLHCQYGVVAFFELVCGIRLWHNGWRGGRREMVGRERLTGRGRGGEIFIAKIAQLVEHDLAKVGVAGSSPVFRSVSRTSSGFLHIIQEG